MPIPYEEARGRKRAVCTVGALGLLLAACAMVSSSLSRRVAAISLVETPPHQASVDWLWKQWPEQAVRARRNQPISTDHPAGSPRLGGGFIDKSVPAGMAQQFLGLGGGTPALLRRISVNRQDLWTYGPAITGGKDFIGEGKVPSDVPIIGLA